MFQFLTPKFRFGLFLIDSSKSNFYKQNQNNNHLPVVCHADTYEIKEDGSIIFYQTIKTKDDKKFKVPVLSYPQGKWEACVLLDDNNDFPVFKPNANINYQGTQKIDEENYGGESDESMESLRKQLSNEFALTINEKQFQSNSVGTQQHILGVNHGQTQGNGMPGINVGQNPQEFKKQKEEWLESEIKGYLKEEDTFNMKDFLLKIMKNSQNKAYKTTEIDVIWSASKLIRAKSVMARSFSEHNIQKSLSLILPDIMRRQWDGKMAPILQILQEREETKNATAIDLAVWMVQNNY